MGKKKPRGVCRICGEYKKLTFEHAPPGATYNKRSVRFVSLHDYIEAEKQNDTMPWELDKIKGKISQRGRGGYYICESCNNNTGSWYGAHYKRFVDALMYVHRECSNKPYQSVNIEIREMRPLPILKQVMTMFCDINENLTENDPDLRSFILDKTDTNLDTTKYRICMYMMKGGLERTAPLSSMINLGAKEAITISEISAVPVGFILYYDLPPENKLLGTEITNFTQCNYEDQATLSMALNIYENNTWLPTDFRSKEEIKAQIEKSKQWGKGRGFEKRSQFFKK